MSEAGFLELIDDYGAANPPTMPFSEGMDHASWRASFMEKLNALFGPVPNRVEPSYVIEQEEVLEDHTRYTIRIAVSEFSNLPAYLLVPKGIPSGERRPLVLACHGHHHAGMDTVCGIKSEGFDGDEIDDYGLAAVRSGYIVCAPSWWGWTGRDQHTHLCGGRDKCNVIQMAASMYGFNIISLHVQDAQAAIDALIQRDDVDANCIASLGNSYGGRSTMWISIFEERIRAIIAAGCMNTFRERSSKLSSCAIQFLPGVLQYGDVPELLALLAPRSLQLQAGKLDGLITATDRDHIEETVRFAYRSRGVEDQLDYVLHERGHVFNWAAADAFLQRSFA